MLDPKEQKLVENVRDYGFHSMNVHADDEGPGFRYSIGFWESVAAPELIIFGLDPKLMHNMLWEIFRQIKAGAKPLDGARWPNLIEGFDCVSRPVHSSQMPEYFGFAIWYKRYRGHDANDLQAFQLFWPGAVQGLYPWEQGCSPDVIDHQPALYLPR